MGIVLGIDIGGSTTKIIGMEDGTMKQPVSVKARYFPLYLEDAILLEKSLTWTSQMIASR